MLVTKREKEGNVGWRRRGVVCQTSKGKRKGERMQKKGCSLVVTKREKEGKVGWRRWGVVCQTSKGKRNGERMKKKGR